jgi:hypothetical protein
MPRDLTDLMESATSFAPPEPHHAAEITRLAAQRQRRRTTGLVGGLALAVVAAGALGYGVTRGHDRAPEPAAPYRYGQHQTLSEAIPSSSAPGFRTLDYGLPSVNPVHGGHAAFGRYHGIDAEGRLIDFDATFQSGSVGTFSYRLAEGPDGPVHDIAQPPLSLLNDLGHDLQWDVALTDDGRLLWHPAGTFDANGTIATVLSDLDGSHQRPIGADTSTIPVHTIAGFPIVRQFWVDGERAYVSVATRDNGRADPPVEWVSLYSYPLSDVARIEPVPAAHDVLSIDESHGEAVWVNADATRIYADDLSTGARHVVPMPLAPGCHIPPPKAFFQGTLPLLRTNGDLVALTEYCGPATRIVVTDLSGRLVTEVDPGPHGALYGMALGARTLTFGSVTPSGQWYADDLKTGSLVSLGRGSSRLVNDRPSSAGDYVLWYDQQGGHVGEFTD